MRRTAVNGGLLAAILVGCAGAPVVTTRVADPFADAGTAALQQIRQLASDYGCPEAPPAADLPDGGRYEDEARAAREDCLLTRSAAEVFIWRGLADAGALQAPQSTPAAVHWAGAIGAVASAVAAFLVLLRR